MKDIGTVKKLSDYSEKDLENLQYLISTAYVLARNTGNITAMREADAWAYTVRQALEDKRDEYATFQFV